jgi:HEPN domain-containing protein
MKGQISPFCAKMITRSDLKKIARARLRDAEVLYRSRRYDGAIYLCGYAVELALKAKIYKTLSWSGYPSTGGEFQNDQSFRTHNLDVLLRLSGVEERIKTILMTEWSAVAAWDPEARYKPIGSATKQAAELMLASVRVLLREL